MYDIDLTERPNLIVAGFLGIACGALLVYAIRAIAGRSRGDDDERDVVDVAADDSFPASDPPSWTTGRA